MSAQLYFLSSHQCGENCASKTATCLGLPNLCQEQPSFEPLLAAEPPAFEAAEEPMPFSSVPMARASVAYSRSTLAARIEAAKERYMNPLTLTRPVLN